MNFRTCRGGNCRQLEEKKRMKKFYRIKDLPKDEKRPTVQKQNLLAAFYPLATTFILVEALFSA